MTHKKFTVIVCVSSDDTMYFVTSDTEFSEGADEFPDVFTFATQPAEGEGNGCKYPSFYTWAEVLREVASENGEIVDVQGCIAY